MNLLPVSNFALGLNIHARDHLFNIAHNTTLNSLALEDNVTSLTDAMRNALSNSSVIRSWDYETNADFGSNDLIHAFAEQVDDMTNNIFTNAAMLLDEMELYLSSPHNVTDNFQDVEMAGDGFRFNESSSGAYLNLSLTSGDGKSWLEGIEHEVSIIEAWEVEVEKLALIATTAFQALKSDTSDVMENGAREATAVLKTKSDDMFREIQTEHQQRINSLAHSIDKIDMILHEEKTWKSGGFEVEDVIPPDIALETILSIPLKTFKLRDDKQRDLRVNKGERRTRHHVGVIDRGDDDAIVESSAIFSCNIGAVSHLASSLERISSKLTVSLSFLRHQASLNVTISTLKKQTEAKGGYSFKSPSQLASEVAALETEAALTRILRHSLSVAASIRLNLTRSRLVSQLKSLGSKSQYSERSGVIESDSVFEYEIYADHTGSFIDRLLIYSEVLGKIKAAWNATEREFAEIHEEAKSESRIATEEVHADAAVERENEASSLERIQLVGKARLNEVIAACELFFRHLSEFLQHIVTPQGREQFMFYVGAVAVLVFTMMTLKEMITLGCVCILRFVTAPRLVREYGNLNTQLRTWFPHQAKETSEIVLPTNIKERIDIVVKVASVASKRQLPLRSVLIYGKPGTGKSVAAKAIAHSIPDLPFAVMTGADVYPMGSQGPAELRRLLTWASKKQHGGIIIIDQAEAALGSRARVEPDKLGDDKVIRDGSASRRYSRDCLNVLLSMTGTFGNIMLILTTSNPSELDEAVLDRMDEIIYLPLPSALERSILLRNKFFCHFKQQHNVDEHNKRFSRKIFLSSLCTSLTKAPFAVNFDAENCVFDLAVKTRGLSGRELEKIVQGVMFKTHASVSGILDMELWRKETAALIKAIAAKHTLKSS